MPLDVQKFLKEAMEEARQEFERRRSLHEEFRRTEVSCQSPDHSIEVVQTCSGEIRSIRIAPGTFERYDEESFGRLLETTLRSATDAVLWARRTLIEDRKAAAHDRG